MRIPFSAIFDVKGNGTVYSRTPIELDGARLSTGMSFSEGISLSGTKLATLKDHDLEVSEARGFIRIDGHY